MTEYEIRTTKLVVMPKGENLFSELATEIEIEDEAAGEFIKISQSGDNCEMGTVKIDPTEWPTLKKAIEQMLKECR